MTKQQTKPRRKRNQGSIRKRISLGSPFRGVHFKLVLNEFPLVFNFSANWLHWELWRLEYFWVLYQGWRCFMDLPPRDGRDLTAVAVGKDAL